jgi:hypothetical protein
LARPQLPRLRQISLLSLALLAFSLPFELETAWLSAGPLLLTNVELLQGVVLLLAAATWLRDPAARQTVSALPRAWLLLLVLFMAGLFLAALLAPAYRGNAMRAALRTTGGIALGLAAASLVHSRRDLVWLIAALLGGGLVAAALGAVEASAQTELAWLAHFRAAPTVAGPFLRLSGTFDYANHAAMYVEATLPFLAVFAWHAWRRGRRVLAMLLAAALFLYGQAAILTFSRASFATIFLANGLVGLLLWSRGWRWSRRPVLPDASARPFLGLALVIVFLIAANTVANPVFRLRFGSEGDSDWYRATIDVPAELQMQAGERQTVRVTVRNEGPFIWRSSGVQPVRLAARWQNLGTGLELSARPRWLFQEPVSPGEEAGMYVVLQAPQREGEYRLLWDLVQEEVVWFSAKSGQEVSTRVSVSGEVAPELLPGLPPESFEAMWQFDPPIPGRRTLWQAAWQLLRASPVLGIGLDNFRLRYGEVIGFNQWNESIHANNWYIETVVSVGLAGAVPFFLWLGLLVWDMAVRIRERPAQLWLAAVAAGLLAYLFHGLLDYFLLFNSTGLLFWILVGLWLRLAHAGVVQFSGR